MIEIEYLIILGLVGFYLYDSAKICFYNEIYILKGFSTRFTVQMQHNRLSIFKKFLMIPPPLFPQYLCFKLCWQVNNVKDDHAMMQNEIEHITHLQRILKPLQFLVYLNAIVMLVLLPVALFKQWSYLILAILMLVIYVLNIINISYIFLQRKHLQLSNLKFTHLLVDALICPPFALNMLQKISLSYDFKTDAMLLAQHLLQVEEFQALLSQTIDDLEILKNNHDVEPKVIEQLNLKQIHLKNMFLNNP
jgi:hypothetical protein